MKKTLFLALLACVTLMFTSCNKEKELPGTSWKSHTVTEQDVTIQGFTAHINLTTDCTMKFTDATNGSMIQVINGSASAMGMTLPYSDTDTTAFTYTFDGKTGGTLTATEDNGETSTIPFTYNKEDNTILISLNEKDEETGMEINIEMVFTEEK